MEQLAAATMRPYRTCRAREEADLRKEDSVEEEQVDWKAALEAVDGRRDLLNELVEIFFSEYPKLLALIRTAIENQNAGDLRLFAHRLKGCLRYFGSNRAGDLAFELEKMGRAGEIADAPTRCAELEAALERWTPALRKFA